MTDILHTLHTVHNGLTCVVPLTEEKSCRRVGNGGAFKTLILSPWSEARTLPDLRSTLDFLAPLLYLYFLFPHQITPFLFPVFLLALMP